jgi:hypothetical protein
LCTLHTLHESMCAQNLWEQTSETWFSYDICTGRWAIFLGAQLCVTARLYQQQLLSGVHTLIQLLSSGVCSVQLLPTTSRRTFVGLRCFHSSCINKRSTNSSRSTYRLGHQLNINYFKQLNISTVGNGTAGASDTDLESVPSALILLLGTTWRSI